MEERDLKYLKTMARQYPTIASAATEIINLQAILSLPKGTEHFMTDIHGEYEQFQHILKNGSGAIKRKIQDEFGNAFSEAEKKSIATLIYYPELKLEQVQQSEEDLEDWYSVMLYRLICVCKNASSKYTRSKVRKALPKDFAYVIEELLNGRPDVSDFYTKLHYMPDFDNIIQITDEEYFTDDIVGLFEDFIKTVYGKDTLETNLDFIAKALGNKGNTSREVIRNYFLNDFFKDHCNTYSVTGSGKRPIYWLFDSGKQNGFKALIYMHRYDADTVGRVRTDYLHKAQKYVETAMQSAQYTIDNATSASEKSKATKAVTKYTKQLAEMKIYDEAIAHVANQRIEIDLDDGVKVNYAKFQGVEVAQEGKKTLKVDLLAKI